MNIKVDSRKVEPGDTFIALRGIAKDGHDYIEQAMENGAIRVIAEEGLYPVETIIANDTREYLIQYLKKETEEALKGMVLIGMTGTNGKTTTCYLIHQLLNEIGKKCGYIGTIGFYIGEKKRDLNNTTPDLLDLYEMLLECKEAGCQYVAMEVSSHALVQRRVAGLSFDYAIFSNLTKDHLDYHLDMHSYALAKQKLFHMLKPEGTAIVNADDDYKNFFLLKENQNITYGFGESDNQIVKCTMDAEGSHFEVENKEEKVAYDTTLLGRHNLYNLLVVIILLKQLGVDHETIKQLMQKAEAPTGRMDTIIYDTNRIIIDYAHTPDAVKKVISTVRELKPNHIITAIGCGGNRDKTKRPEMADIATDLSDYAIFTSDNPRFEEPEAIIADMVTGLKKTNYEVEINREKAIDKGIQMLEENDILLLLGKGHETYQTIGDTKIPFDDKQKVLNYIRR